MWMRITVIQLKRRGVEFINMRKFIELNNQIQSPNEFLDS